MRVNPEQARIRIMYSGIPGVTEGQHIVDVAEDTGEHHYEAVAEAFRLAAEDLATQGAAALAALPKPAPKKAAPKKKATKGRK